MFHVQWLTLCFYGHQQKVTKIQTTYKDDLNLVYINRNYSHKHENTN